MGTQPAAARSYRGDTPLLLSDGEVVVAPLESVAVALEVKSMLDAAKLDEIFAESRSLRELVEQSESHERLTSKTAAFAYTCTNANLAFYDFSVRVQQSGFYSPNAICILESALFALTPQRVGPATLTEDWCDESVPAFIGCGDDALLLFFYLLACWVTDDPSKMHDFARYVRPAIDKAEVFWFDRDFLDAITAKPEIRDRTREVFKGRASVPIATLYARARAAAGLG